MNEDDQKELFLVDTGVFDKDSKYNQKIILFLSEAEQCGAFNICFVGDRSQLPPLPDNLNSSEIRDWSEFWGKNVDVVLSDQDDLNLYSKYHFHSGSPYINGNGFEWFIESYDDISDNSAIDRFHDLFKTLKLTWKDQVATIVKNPQQAFASSLDKQPVSVLMAQFEDTPQFAHAYSQNRLKDDLLFIFEHAVLGENDEVIGQTDHILKQAQENDISEQDVHDAVKAVTTAAIEAERNALS